MPVQTPICDFGQKALPFELKSTENKKSEKRRKKISIRKH